MKTSLRLLLAAGVAAPLLAHAAGTGLATTTSAAPASSGVVLAARAGTETVDQALQSRPAAMAALGLAVLAAVGFIGQRRRPD